MATGDFPMYREGWFSISSLSYTTQIEKLKERLAAVEAENAILRGRVHRALQDAYAAGGIEMASKQDRNFTEQKHKWCDNALKALLKGERS